MGLQLLKDNVVVVKCGSLECLKEACDEERTVVVRLGESLLLLEINDLCTSSGCMIIYDVMGVLLGREVLRAGAPREETGRDANGD